MAQDDAIPPIPVPPPAGAVPPVEPPPAAPAQPPAAPPPPAAGSPYAPTAGSPYAPPPPAPYGAAGYAAQPAAPAQGLAIASLACGIGGLLLVFIGFGFFASVAAVITGHLAQRRQPYARGFWITGLITGYIGIGIGLIFGLVLLLSIVAVFSTSYYG